MTVVSKWYGQAFSKAFNKEIDFDTDNIKLLLATAAYTPDQDNHVYLSHITGEVAAGNGYVSGGQLITSKSVLWTPATNVFSLLGANVTWDPSSVSANFAVLYDDSPATTATKPLISYVDFGGTVTSANGPFKVTWDAAGLVNVTVS